MRPDLRRNVKFALWGAVPCQQHNWLWLVLRVSSHLGRTLVVLDVNRNDCIKRHAHPANLLHPSCKVCAKPCRCPRWISGGRGMASHARRRGRRERTGMETPAPRAGTSCIASLACSRAAVSRRAIVFVRPVIFLPLNSFCSPAPAATVAAAVVAIVATHAAAATAGAAEASTIGMVVGHWQVGCLHAGWSSWRRTAASMPVQQRLPAQMSVYPIGFPTVTDSTRAALQLDPAAGAIHATTDPSSPHQWNRIPCQHILGLRYSSSHRRRRCRLSSRRHRHPGPPEKQQQPQTPLPHPTQPAQQQPLPVGIPPLISQ
jgi:hypothetical protein